MPGYGWRYDPNTMAQLISEGRILWPANHTGRPRRKVFLSELSSNFTGLSTVMGGNVFTKHGTSDIDGLFDARLFSFPKPVRLIETVIEQGSSRDDIVLDFFAGSGTTAHAVMAKNASDGSERRFILVQLQEPLDEENRDQKTASDFCDSLGIPRNIAELTKERIRRAAVCIKKANPTFAGDVEFRVLKLDSSNIQVWDPERDNLEVTLLESIEHVKRGRSEDDILYELLLKLGLDLCVPIETRMMAGKTVRSVGAGTLIACLAERITSDEIEPTRARHRRVACRA